MILPRINAFWRRICLVATVGVSLTAGCVVIEAKEGEEVLGKGHDIFIFSDITKDRAIPEWKCAKALEAWEKELSERIGEEVRVSVVSSILGTEGLMMMGKPSVAVVPVVEKGRCVGMAPEFLVEDGGGLHSKFVLIAPRRGAVRQGIIPASVGLFDSTMMMPWSGWVWAQSVLPDLDAKSLKAVNGSDNVVIPVFFGRAAYGIVDQHGFDAEKRRNSQVEEEVKVIAESPLILGNAVFIREDLSKPVVEKLRRELVLSSKEEHGEVVFKVFGWHALRPIAEKEMALIAESLAVVVGDDGDDATVKANTKGGTK